MERGSLILFIEQNGNFLPRNENSYGPDIVSDYAVEFIKKK